MEKLNDDLISRSKLLAAYDAAHKGPPGGARKLIEEAPAEEAVPVVHARWVDHIGPAGYKTGFVECSNCKRIKSIVNKTTWCPNCLAKMDL